MIAIGLADGKLTVITEPIILGEKDAITLAAVLVFRANGNLVSSMQDGKIAGWNFESSFFKEYRKLMEVL